jgi:hypothetical protein
MLIVISPAKKLDMNQDFADIVPTIPALLEDSSTLIDTLRLQDSYAIANLMKISMKLADLNQQRFQAWHRPFTHDNARPALAVFRGDVYQTLDADSFSHSDHDFAQAHLRILSGLYGILRPHDLMQSYRLEMGTALATSRGKNLYEFWSDRISKQLAIHMEQNNSSHLINLASQEYFKSVRPQHIPGSIITPTFKELHNGRYKVIGIHAKRARGLMARFIIQQQITDVEALKDFNEGGYRWSCDDSNAHTWVFCRP